MKYKSSKFIISFITLTNVVVATIVPLTLSIGLSSTLTKQENTQQPDNNPSNPGGGDNSGGNKPDGGGNGSGGGDNSGGNKPGGGGDGSGGGDNSGGNKPDGGGNGSGGDSNTNTDFDKINDDYLKDNKVDVITNGQAYSLATPGSGGADSVRLSPGPSKTEPSPNVISNQELQGNKIYNETDVIQAKKNI